MKAETENYLTECGVWNNIPNITMTREKFAEMLEEFSELQLRKAYVIKSVCVVGRSYNDCHIHNDNEHGCIGCGNYKQTVL